MPSSKEYFRAYYQAHKEEYARRSREWCAKNRQRKAEKARAWALANPDKVRAKGARYARRHPEKMVAKVMKRYHGNAKVRLAVKLIQHKRRAIKSAGNLSPEQWLDICRAHDYRCAYCRLRLPAVARMDGERVLTVDHVEPLSAGGAHVPANVVPACKRCNSSKGARHEYWSFSAKIALMEAAT